MPLRSAPPKSRFDDGPDREVIEAEWAGVAAGVKSALTLACAAPRWPWYFHGAPGTGKTSAAAFIYRIWPGPGAEFRTGTYFVEAAKIVPDLARHIADGDAEFVLRRVCAASLLIIDDIGTRSMTEPQADALRRILNARGGKPMILTGNHSPDALPAALGDDRIVSRLCAGTLIEFTGADRRLQDTLVFEA